MITAVFLPGKLCDHRMWAEVMTALSDVIIPVFIDLSQFETLDDMLLKIDACSNDPMLIVGFSMGGFVAQEYILKYQHKVAGVVLVSSFAEKYDEQGMERQHRMLKFANKFTSLADHTVRQCVHSSKAEDIELMNLIKDMAIKIGKEGFIREQKATMYRETRLEALRSVQCEALVISGDEDNIVPIEATKAMASHLPNARYCEIKNSGHMVPIEQPKLLAVAISDWLVEIGAIR